MRVPFIESDKDLRYYFEELLLSIKAALCLWGSEIVKNKRQLVNVAQRKKKFTKVEFCF